MYIITDFWGDIFQTKHDNKLYRAERSTQSYDIRYIDHIKNQIYMATYHAP